MHPGTFFYNMAGELKVYNNPLTVYDLLRCKKIYKSPEELNRDLVKLHEKYPIIRIKNRTYGNLSHVLVNFKYEFQYGGWDRVPNTNVHW